MAFKTMVIVVFGLTLYIMEAKTVELNRLVVPALVNLRRSKHMGKRVRWNGGGRHQTNREFLLILLLLLLLSGDVETNPGPVSFDQFKEMNKSQRAKVLKPDMEMLLNQLAEKNDVGDGPSNADVLNELKEIKKDLLEIKGLKVKVDTNEKKISDLETEVKNLKEAVVAQQKFWEETDKEKRCKKLIFLGIKEDETADNAKVDNILTHLEIADDIEITEVKRLGRIREPDEGNEPEQVHKRPLLVEVECKEMRNNVLKNARKLKEVNEQHWMRTVFIKADEHPEIRKEMKRLHDVFKEEKNKPENTGVEIKFDRKARKVTRNGEEIDSFRVLSLFQ